MVVSAAGPSEHHDTTNVSSAAINDATDVKVRTHPLADLELICLRSLGLQSSDRNIQEKS